jgi:HIV Tat-specific factor 1
MSFVIERNVRLIFRLLPLQVESVELALNVLDGYDVRGHKISVTRAEFQMRGEYNPALKPKKRKNDKEKMKKMQEK